MSIPSPDDTFGALLVGALITMTIYGITTLQTYFYYMTYPKDSINLKLLVAVIWIIDTTHVTFMCHAMHHYLIVGFANPILLYEGIWSLYSSILLNVITSFIVQMFFTKRIHDLCPPKYRWYATSVVLVTVLAHVAFGLETVIHFFLVKTFLRLHEYQKVGIIPFGVTAIVSDIVIAVGLCVLLESNRSQYADTNALINALVGYAISRCLLTTIVAVVELAVSLALPYSFYSIAIDFVIGKLWSNSLLASLNSRRSLRNMTKTNIISSSGGNLSRFQAGPRHTSTGTFLTTEPGPISLVRINHGENTERSFEGEEASSVADQESTGNKYPAKNTV